MLSRSIVPAPKNALSLHQALELTHLYLENAYKTTDRDIALLLCHDAEVALTQAKNANKKIHTRPGDTDYQVLRDGVAAAYIDLGKLLERQGYPDLFIPGNTVNSGAISTVVPANTPSSIQQGLGYEIDSHIFPTNVGPPATDIKLPEPDERLNSTPQLACCLGLLQASRLPDVTLDPTADRWLLAIENDTDEQDRLHGLAIELVRAYKRDEIKDAKIVNEVLYLAPVLNKDAYQDLLREFYSGIDHSGLLSVHQLEGIAQLIQGCGPGYLDADDLVKILGLLSTRLGDTHQQSTQHMRQLTLAVSHVLDAMADANVTGLDREKVHEPLSLYLKDLKGSSDPYLVYQAAYAYQALLCVPDNETAWQAAMRRTGKVIRGVSGLVSAVRGLDLVKFIEGLDDIQKGLAGAFEVVEMVTSTYDNVKTLAESGHEFVDCLKGGFSFERRRDWYSALRGADVLIRDGELATFKKLVCEVHCRLDPAFQWGVCQRLGEIAANPIWDSDVQRSAITFLGEIYRNDAAWGRQPSVKRLVINILMQLNTSSTIALPELASPSLLDRVQNRPDVDGALRLLRKQRTKARGNNVYIPPLAKPSFNSLDDSQFPLMEKVNEFLESDHKVFLVLGDSGAGKSTFGRELEYELWRSYKSKSDPIPLHINLPTIDKPEHDMIAKQLRRTEFTEPQIREMKHYRRFILICDGYDESQQTRNLYMSNELNQPGGWDAQMVITCRSEYLGDDYRDRFQPGDRNKQQESSLFQEAVISPFSIGQVHAYIHQYVSLHQPLWQSGDYKDALERIPSLKDLVKNPFLMTLSLEVLPRIVDPGQQLSTTRVTRVGLYDHFVEQWLERGKKRLGEKGLSPQVKTAFERLSAEGFTANGIGFMKKLAVAMYKEQEGHPVVEYLQLVDEGSWKDEFFKDEHKYPLLESSPLIRNGNQHRFIHRSLLEYALARAVFDPQERRNRSVPGPSSGRRGSASSILSFEVFGEEKLFLQERAQQEPVFKEQLLDYIEYSKKDKKWRTAAANAITILVRAGVKFNGSDLRCIQIPGADLSYGAFDSAHLEDADLRKANLRGIWMRQTDLSRAQMAGVQFGELPFLTENDEVRSCAYSPDGRTFAVGLGHGDVSVYATSSWERTLRLNHDCDGGSVRRVVYSSQSDQMATCGDDNTVKLWDAETGECLHILREHT
ncbi:hypothetical protein BGX34_001454, partial [Mortierella sp. NVP85]